MATKIDFEKKGKNFDATKKSTGDLDESIASKKKNVLKFGKK